MNGVKLILIALELVMLIGVFMLTFMTDWVKVSQLEEVWMFKAMIVLLSLCAVILQSEQQKIEWDIEEE